MFKTMKIFRTLIAGALLAVGTSAMAQATYTAADGTEYQFKKHLFLDLQGGFGGCDGLIQIAHQDQPCLWCSYCC